VHDMHRRGLIDRVVDWCIGTVDRRGRSTERQLLFVGAGRPGRLTEDMGQSTEDMGRSTECCLSF